MTSSGSSPSGPSLSLSPEHEMIRQTARDFAQKEIAPIAAEFDESGEFPSATVRKMGEMGLMGIEVPEEYGGAGMDTLAYVLAQPFPTWALIGPASVQEGLASYDALETRLGARDLRWLNLETDRDHA